MTDAGIVQPRHFFLNEQHELTHAEKEGGGRAPVYVDVDWTAKGSSLNRSLKRVQHSVAASHDPLRDRHYFMVALPASEVARASAAKTAQQGKVVEGVSFGGDHSKVFRRLGMDLLGVAHNGNAMVHVQPEQLERLLASSGGLDRAGPREKGRWVALDSFDIVPVNLKVDSEWIEEFDHGQLIEALIELQPLLMRPEIDEVMRVVASFLRQALGEQRLVATGSDFSGRQWFRGLMTGGTALAIAENLQSVQSIHPPLYTPITATSGGRRATAHSHKPVALATASDSASFPTVAILDTGVPMGHALLSPYCRGRYVAPDAPEYMGHHGSCVASRIVFGDYDYESGAELQASCKFLDVAIPEREDLVDDKNVVGAMSGVIAAYPDVRVFNLSFGDYRSWDSYPPVERRERLAQVRELDNFIFARDVVVVVAAGNSPPGQIPSTAYPRHYQDPAWRLGHWPLGFNSLACGATVEKKSIGGLVDKIGWPSPFSRIGPGLVDSPVPEFSAHGGNCTPEYGYAPGLGVWACTADGLWEDRPGTSLSAPLLARQAALGLRALQSACQGNTRPYASTIKAVLVLTASLRPVEKRIRDLASRTLGHGTASARPLTSPDSSAAMFIWQGVLEGPKDTARVQLAIPRAWLRQATTPRLRIVVSWDTPANDAVLDLWGCRKVELQLRHHVDTAALTGTRRGHGSYPLN